MANNIDYREIVQTVTSNVLSDVKSQLASMQPGIVDDIVKQALSPLQPTLDSLASQLSDVQKRLAQLEQKLGSSLPQSTPTQASSVDETADTSSSAESESTDASSADATAKTSSSNVIKPWLQALVSSIKGLFPGQMDTETRILFLKLKKYEKIYWREWIIYFDTEKKGVFMIRRNGKDLRDITDSFKELPHRFNRILENGSDLIIEYDHYGSYTTEYAAVPKP